ncbi:AAA family ATPase [Nitratireductor sp. XY-223]|uniref:ATP-dependent nuclease n=1 Tax=Nitratireductor sp. XY-223 TaxID=2561926 RepID=UPI00145BC9D0|nr:AAA family ATPase [Nitratireductor sp. XY-223]
MRVTELRIQNFRSIKNLNLELGKTTVFIGPNNSGKTAILDAVRIALTRKWGQRGTGFTEYDIHLATESDDPKVSPGVSIEIRTEEEQPGEWPDELQQDLDDISQLDAVTGKSFITLRASCVWNAADAAFLPAWEFLNAARAPLVGRSGRRVNLERFWQYLPVFYLGALRDADDEFSSRSQFWGRLLKAMEIPSALEARVQRLLDILNRKLLQADPRLAQVADVLSGATRVAARDRAGSVDLRLVPLKSWDLLSKAEIILRNEPDWPWLPLQRHGQGVQSLSVVFLFQAFVEHLLAELYEEHSVPVLALEEPETHLHPQAARTLWAHVNELPGQKIITTHSPYFVQHVPFRDIRLVRLTEDGTEVRWLPPSFSVQVPDNAELAALVGNNAQLLDFDTATQTLTVGGKLEEPLYRDLLTCYGIHADRAVISGVLHDLKDRSQQFISDDELKALETYARRIRGEIFFAHRWFIVEGQAEYLIVHALARELDYDLDEHGVSLIDAMNNGNPATFAALARAFGIPWCAVFDGDQAGNQYIQSIKDRDFDDAYVDQRCAVHPNGDLEGQLLADGLEPELRTALNNTGQADAMTIDRPTLELRLGNSKVHYAAELAAMLRGNPELAARMPQTFRDAIGGLRGLA